jgi:NDP-sugar pyrophosphorylase family protein
MERDVYEKIAENGVLNGFPFEGMFVDAGTPESFVEATQACINSGRFSTGETKDSTWFGNNVVNSGKIISSSVGRNSRVGNGTIVENSVILEGVKIGENCSIRNCLIGNNCIIHDGTSLDGIILDHGITVE